MSKVKIEVSARHLHLNQQDLEALFGDGYQLSKDKDLSQPGEFASTDVVTLEGPKNKLEKVRIVGPCRQSTQIEVSRSDSFYLGVNAPLRLSGKTIRSGAIKVIGPKGELELEEGLIVAKRHLHISQDQAGQKNLSNGQNIKVSVDGPRALIFDEVEVRVGEDYDLALHLDTDESNAAGVNGAVEATLIIE